MEEARLTLRVKGNASDWQLKPDWYWECRKQAKGSFKTAAIGKSIESVAKTGEKHTRFAVLRLSVGGW